MYIHTDQCCNVKWQLANIFRSKPVTIIWALAYWSWDLKNLMFSWRWISEILACAWRLLYCLWCCSCGSQFGRAGYKTVINWCQVLSVLVRDLVGCRRIICWGWSNHRVSSFRRGDRGQTQNSVFLVNIQPGYVTAMLARIKHIATSS